MIKQIVYTGVFCFIVFTTSYSLTAQIEGNMLLGLTQATTTEMNAVINPFAGNLLYNTDEKSVYFYTGVLWKKLKPDGSETMVNATNTLFINGNGTAQSPYIISQ